MSGDRASSMPKADNVVTPKTRRSNSDLSRSIHTVGHSHPGVRQESTNARTNKHEYRLNKVDRVNSVPESSPVVSRELALDDHPTQFFETWANPMVSPIPKFYPVSCSAAKIIRDGFSVETFRKNLFILLRIMSIQVVKSCSEPASISLLTPEFVEIHVTLWLSRNGEHVIVEVQRMRGDSITYYNYANKILRLAREPETDMTQYTQVTLDMDLRHLLKADGVLWSEENVRMKESWSSTLNVVHRLVTAEDSIDLMMSGMESLCVLTDARRTGVSMAAMFGDALWFGKAPSSKDVTCVCEIRCLWFSILTEVEPEEHSLSSDELIYDSDDDLEDDAEKTKDYLVYLASSVLFNVLELMLAMSKIRESVHPSAMCGSMFGVDFRETLESLGLVEALVQGVCEVKCKPQIACLCAKALSILCAACGTHVLKGDLKARTLSAATLAQQHGQFCHSNLERASNQLLETLHNHVA